MASQASSSSPLAPPADLRHHLSKVASHRDASMTKQIYKYFMIPGIGDLAGGRPHVSFFPYDTLEAQVAKPERWAPTPSDLPDFAVGEPLARQPGSTQDSGPSSAATHLTVSKSVAQADPMKKIDLETALQYGTAEGYPPLRSFIRQFTRETLHPGVPYLDGPEVILTCGSTEGFDLAVNLLVDPWYPETDPVSERPGMLCEVFAYGNALSNVRPKGVQVVPVRLDGEGMMASGPGGLRDVLENWDLGKGRRPHFMYSVTMGHNPTGGVLSVQRRREIYALCCKYDIIIVEDDPYWYLQYASAAALEARSRGLATPAATTPSTAAGLPPRSSGFDFIDALVPSYLSIDTQGRVIRLDTFSKTVAPGCRLGWITAQPMFIERLLRATETSTQQPSGFVQSVVAQTVMGSQPEAMRAFRSLSRKDRLSFSGWDVAGWVRWLAGLRGVYERRMQRMCSILDEGAYQLKQSSPVRESDADWGVITKTRLLSFDWPRGGMFVWLRVHFENHPLWQATGHTVPLLDGPVLSTAFFVFCTHKPNLVLFAPGTMFGASPEIAAAQAWAFIRVCFAAAPEDDIVPISHRLVDAVRRFWRIKSIEQMEELVNDFSAVDEDALGGAANLVSSAGMGC